MIAYIPIPGAASTSVMAALASVGALSDTAGRAVTILRHPLERALSVWYRDADGHLRSRYASAGEYLLSAAADNLMAHILAAHARSSETGADKADLQGAAIAALDACAYVGVYERFGRTVEGLSRTIGATLEVPWLNARQMRDPVPVGRDYVEPFLLRNAVDAHVYNHARRRQDELDGRL